MTNKYLGLMIGVLGTTAFLAALVATYGLTSKSYLETFIVFQVSSGQGLQQNGSRSMNDIMFLLGRNDAMHHSPPITTLPTITNSTTTLPSTVETKKNP
jgi:hypothetical protein